MAKPGDRIVYKHPKGWADRQVDASRPAKVHQTQAEAQKASKQHSASAGGGEVTVQGRDGKFVSKDTVAPGNDPCPPRDTEH